MQEPISNRSTTTVPSLDELRLPPHAAAHRMKLDHLTLDVFLLQDVFFTLDFLSRDLNQSDQINMLRTARALDVMTHLQGTGAPASQIIEALLHPSLVKLAEADRHGMWFYFNSFIEGYAFNGIYPPQQARLATPCIDDWEWIEKDPAVRYPVVPGVNDNIPPVPWAVKQTSSKASPSKCGCDLTSREWRHKRQEIIDWCLGETSPTTPLTSLYTPQERELLTQAIHDTYSLLLSDLTPRSASRDITSLFQHVGLVTSLLISAKAPVDVVIAGLLHDMHELKFDTYSDEDLSRVICDRYGSRVNDLVELVTEPPKSSSPTDFITRKTAVLENILHAPMHLQGDAATIVAASKIATLTDGQIYFYRKNTLKGWSSGSAEQNVEAARILFGHLAQTDMNPSVLYVLARKVTEWKALTNPESYKLHASLGTLFNMGMDR